MNQKQLLLKKIRAATFAIAIIFGSSSAFAQVKIGTNPTTIETNSNLEVEASTTGRKVKVDKTSGQVTIADGTQGAGKILTSDTDGNASWQTNGTGCGSFEAKRTGVQSVVIQDNVNVYTNLIASTEIYDPLNAYNPVNGAYTIPADGFYIVTASSTDIISGVFNATRHSTLQLMSVAKGLVAASVQQRVQYGDGCWNSVTGTGYFNAGDVLTIQNIVTHVSGTKPATNIDIRNIIFSGTRVDCDKN